MSQKGQFSEGERLTWVESLLIELARRERVKETDRLYLLVRNGAEVLNQFSFVSL